PSPSPGRVVQLPTGGRPPGVPWLERPLGPQLPLRFSPCPDFPPRIFSTLPLFPFTTSPTPMRHQYYNLFALLNFSSLGAAGSGPKTGALLRLWQAKASGPGVREVGTGMAKHGLKGQLVRTFI